MASYHAAAARRRRATGPAPSLTGPASDVHPVLRRTTAPPAALDLLVQSGAGLGEQAEGGGRGGGTAQHGVDVVRRAGQ